MTDGQPHTTTPPARHIHEHITTMSSIPTHKSAVSKDQPMAAPSPAMGLGSGLRYPMNGKTIYHRTLNRTRTSELSQASFAYLFAEMVSYAQRRVTGIQDLEKRYAAHLPLRLPPSTPASPPDHRQALPVTKTPADRCTRACPPAHRLNVQGHPIGLKLLDLLLHREPPRSQLRPRDIITLLHFVKIQLWTHLFGRQADAIQRSSNPDTPDEYMIIDNEPLVNAYISVPREMSQLNCAAYVAGMIEGVCDGSGFPARVTAHSVGNQAAHGGGGGGGQEAGAAAGAAAPDGGPVQEMWPGKTVFLVKFSGEVIEREAYLGVAK